MIVTGNPLGRAQLAQPAQVLGGDGLVLRRAATLGETLDGLPGVAASWFGPNSSRPVIRGLDGDRVRILDNGGAAVDASNLSFDHAVAIDPLVAERLEVLRGPAALLYGGNATGGVVNSIDNRIPRSAVAGVGGRAELRLGGATRERAGAAVLEGGGGAFAWHADAFGRDTDDLRVPRFTPVDDGVALAPSTTVRNSAARVRGGALGGSWVGRDGHLGLAVDSYRNDYGITAEPDVLIRMKHDRWSVAGERRGLPGPVTQFELQASRTDYGHQEVEGSGEVGTTFASVGDEWRLQARHAALGPLAGVVGIQSQILHFSALGDEAFVPGTRTRSHALFVIEELRSGALTFGGGLRAESVDVRSDGDAPDAEAPRFGPPAERRFSPLSASLSALWAAGGGWSLSASLGHTERAPAYYELYADGLHLATGAYERGDPALALEKGRHVELRAEWTRGARRLAASLFDTDFSNYIALDATGSEVEVEGEDGPQTVPEYAFRGVPARLRGFELEGSTRLIEAGWTLDLLAGIDGVRGDNRASGEPLPRLPPVRANLGLDATGSRWRAGIGLRHAAEQTRVPASDAATAAYTLLSLWAQWSGTLFGADASWFARLDNVTDELAFNASTVGTLRPLAPLPGRALSAGVRLGF